MTWTSPNARRFKPLAEMRCRVCQTPPIAEGAILAVVGAEVWPYCCSTCARNDGIWPWTVPTQLPLLPGVTA